MQVVHFPPWTLNIKGRSGTRKISFLSPECAFVYLVQGRAGRTSHLRVPPFRAYKPPRSQGPMPANKPAFSSFPLPMKSFPQISGLQPSKPCWHSSNHPSHCPFSFSSTPTCHQNSHHCRRYLSAPINTHQRCFWAFLATSMACVLAVHDSEHTYRCISSPFLAIFCG